jgi:hypothetical protein
MAFFPLVVSEQCLRPSVESFVSSAFASEAASILGGARGMLIGDVGYQRGVFSFSDAALVSGLLAGCFAGRGSVFGLIGARLECPGWAAQSGIASPGSR